MKKLTLAAFTILLTSTFATPALAQEPSRSLESYSKELSLQYSVLRDIGEVSPFGVLVDFGKSLKGGWSLVGEIDTHYFSSMEETYAQAAGGVRFGKMLGSKRVFVQFVAGPQYSFGDTGIAYQPGAGLNMKLGKRVDARIQVDFPIVRWQGDTYEQVRISMGLGLPLGGR